ncbi:MAG TPA: TetR/AcrR family transcriptional regulator [Solirubrobacterales bacterium]|nr:TetR/AcrR family transcriptional regulator [Solirubrobacterales bacterium]
MQTVSLKPRPPRLTRDEQRRRTRERLLASALEVFEARGYAESSLEEIAERAGHTRKAVYSNFSGKGELLLEIVERRFQSHIDQIESIVSEATSADRKATDIGSVFSEFLNEERAWMKLFHEFCSVASRNDEIGARFQSCFRDRKKALVRLVESEASRRGVELSVPVERLVMGICALFTGIALEKTIDPAEIDDELFGQTLGLLAASAVKST